MKIISHTLNKSFDSKEKLFSELKKNEENIIKLKCSEKMESINKGQISAPGSFIKKDAAQKAGIELEDGFIYPVINTTRYLDSHDDVHFDGLWNKSVSEQKGKIYYVSGHKLDIDSVIAWPEDVEMLLKNVSWSMVGKEYPGETEALIFKIAEEKIVKQSVLEAIERKRKFEGSVSMRYIKIRLAIDSNDKAYAENKSYWDSKINDIANIDKAIEQGYFFGVHEAMIYKEGSLVLAGSNDATEIIYPKNITLDENSDVDEPGTPTPNEPDNSTKEQTERKKSFLLQSINQIK